MQRCVKLENKNAKKLKTKWLPIMLQLLETAFDIDNTGDFPFLVKEPILKINHEYGEYFHGGIPVIIGGVMLNNAVIESEIKSCYTSDQTWEYLKDKGVECLSMQKLALEETLAYVYMTSQRLNVIAKIEVGIRFSPSEKKTHYRLCCHKMARKNSFWEEYMRKP